MAERKALDVELKAEKEGAFRCTFATLNVIDKDGDVTLPGAFKEAPVRVSQFGHNWGAYIIGDGTIAADKSKAWADAEFYLETSNGLDTYRSVKRASAAGLQQWSYGFDVVKYSFGKFEDREVRFLEELEVHEVSPVMLGAGEDTGTDYIKSNDGGLTLALRTERFVTDSSALLSHTRAAVSMRAKEGRVLSTVTRGRLKTATEALDAALRDLSALLAETDSSGDDDAKAALHALRSQFLANTAALAGRN